MMYHVFLAATFESFVYDTATEALEHTLKLPEEATAVACDGPKRRFVSHPLLAEYATLERQAAYNTGEMVGCVTALLGGVCDARQDKTYAAVYNTLLPALRGSADRGWMAGFLSGAEQYKRLQDATAFPVARGSDVPWAQKV